MVNKNITISLPEKLIEKLENKIKETDFDSISDYLIYVLKQVLEKETESNSKREVSYSKEEEEAVKRRLKELGYI